MFDKLPITLFVICTAAAAAAAKVATGLRGRRYEIEYRAQPQKLNIILFYVLPLLAITLQL